jgi:hypothetical protein
VSSCSSDFEGATSGRLPADFVQIVAEFVVFADHRSGLGAGKLAITSKRIDQLFQRAGRAHVHAFH